MTTNRRERVRNGDRRELGAVEPALDDLSRKQDDLFSRLSAGFPNRREVLLWLQDASFRTLGQVSDDWFANLIGSRYQLAALLDGSETRRAVSKRAADEKRAAVERGVLADDTLVEGCRKGMQVLSRQAAEYVDSDDAPIDTSAQSYLAMRPAIDDLARRQQRVLDRALGYGPRPIESRADVREWVRDVVRATKGADEGFGQKVLWSPYWLDSLRGEPTSATLHLLLADELLPPMNAALRETAAAATEQASENRTSHGAFET